MPDSLIDRLATANSHRPQWHADPDLFKDARREIEHLRDKNAEALVIASDALRDLEAEKAAHRATKATQVIVSMKSYRRDHAKTIAVTVDVSPKEYRSVCITLNVLAQRLTAKMVEQLKEYL